MKMALQTCGPTTSIQLWVPRGIQTTVAPLDVTAEISTAASQTCIQEGLATSLGLEPVGMTTLSTLTKLQYDARQYRVRMVFPSVKLAFEVLVTEVPYLLGEKSGKRIRCLIGQDILQYACLTYDGPAQAYSLTFRGVPHEQRDTSTAAQG